ncbi:MAG: hypothetical protein R2726_14010 [Acidimicrobiales bacterium]
MAPPPNASTGWGSGLPEAPPLAPPPAGSGAARSLPVHPPEPGTWPGPAAGGGNAGGPAGGPGGDGFLGGPRNVAIVAAAAVVAIALVVAAFVVRSSGDEQAASASSTTSTTRRPSTSAPGASSTTTTPGPSTTRAPNQPTTPTTPAGPPIDQATLDAEVARLSAYVAQQRGLSFTTPVKAEVLDDAAFTERLKRQIPPEELQAQAAMLQMLGLVPPGEDPAALIEQTLVEGVQGWYDAEAKELVVRGGSLNDDVRQTLVHELTHALDDQSLNLRRPEYDERKDEIAFGFKALVEGDATRIERAWHDEFNPNGAPPGDEVPAAAGGGSTSEQAVKAQIGSPYILGNKLVRAILASGGQAVLDRSFADPPVTSEQVAHPEKYATREPRKEVPPPPAEGKVTKDGVFGEVMTQQLLAGKLPSDQAETAATGWGGDWYVTWTDQQGASCVRVDWQMDTPTDLTELKTAFDAFTQAGGPGQVETPNPDTVRWTNCSAVTGGGVSPL